MILRPSPFLGHTPAAALRAMVAFAGLAYAAVPRIFLPSGGAPSLSAFRHLTTAGR